MRGELPMQSSKIQISIPPMMKFYETATHLVATTSFEDCDQRDFSSPAHEFKKWLMDKGINFDEYVACVREKDYSQLVRICELWAKENFGKEVLPKNTEELLRSFPDMVVREDYKPGYVYLKPKEA
jgi:hypothetical protein